MHLSPDRYENAQSVNMLYRIGIGHNRKTTDRTTILVFKYLKLRKHVK